MDLGSPSNKLVVARTPFLPGLLKFGESTATETGKEPGGPRACARQCRVTATGERSAAIGGDALHSPISTGDQHDR